MGKKFLFTDNQLHIITKCREIFAEMKLDGRKKEDFDRDFGISYSSIRRYAKGELDIPLSVLLKMAEITKTDLSKIFGGEKPVVVESSTVLLETISNLNKIIAAKEAEIDALKGDAVNYTTKHANAASSAENQTKN